MRWKEWISQLFVSWWNGHCLAQKQVSDWFNFLSHVSLYHLDLLDLDELSWQRPILVQSPAEKWREHNFFKHYFMINLFMMEDILDKTLKKNNGKSTMMNWFIYDGRGFDQNIRAGWNGKAKIRKTELLTAGRARKSVSRTTLKESTTSRLWRRKPFADGYGVEGEGLAGV